MAVDEILEVVRSQRNEFDDATSRPSRQSPLACQRAQICSFSDEQCDLGIQEMGSQEMGVPRWRRCFDFGTGVSISETVDHAPSEMVMWCAVENG
jgi:hypothetical protein